MRLHSILEKTWVWPFYKVYSGLFFILLLFTFGILKAEEHIALAIFFVEEPINLLYPFGAILLLEILSLSYSKKCIGQKTHRFLLELSTLNSKERYLHFLAVLLKIQLVPVIYTAFLLIIAFINFNPAAIITIFGFALFKLYLSLRALNNWIDHPSEKKYLSRFNYNFLYRVNFHLAIYYLKHLSHNKKLMVFLSKVFSFIILFIGIFLLETIDFYARFIAFTVLVSFISNSFIVFDINDFVHRRWSFMKSLPVSRLTIYLQTVMLTVLFITPEILFIYRNFHVYTSFFDLLTIILFSFSVLMFFMGLAIKNQVEFKAFISKNYWIPMLLFLIVMYDFPLIIFSLMFMFISIYCFYYYFYRFEIDYTQ